MRKFDSLLIEFLKFIQPFYEMVLWKSQADPKPKWLSATFFSKTEIGFKYFTRACLFIYCVVLIFEVVNDVPTIQNTKEKPAESLPFPSKNILIHYFRVIGPVSNLIFKLSHRNNFHVEHRQQYPTSCNSM